MLPRIVYALIGGCAGAVLGHVGRCSSGTCPLTSTWWRGAICGAVLGAMLCFISGTKSPGSMKESNGNVKAIGESQFDAEVVRASLPVVVDFYASWCGPCKVLSPLLDELAGPLTNRIKFIKVDVDGAPALAQRFDIRAVPTLLFFKNGKIVDRTLGLLPEDALKSRLESLADISAPQHETR
jgi:thioredoxin 1